MPDVNDQTQITIEHPDLPGQQARVSHGAFVTAGGFREKGWRQVAEEEAPEPAPELEPEPATDDEPTEEEGD